MKRIFIDSISWGLFSNSGLDLDRGSIFRENTFTYLVRKGYIQNSLRMPFLSEAHVRQAFLRQKGLEYALASYGVDPAENYPLAMDDQDVRKHSHYIAKAHQLCMDRGIEDAYYDFFYAFARPIAIKWCQDNGIDYTCDPADEFAREDTITPLIEQMKADGVYTIEDYVQTMRDDT